MKKHLFIIVLSLLCFGQSYAQGGMWVPSAIEDRIADMSSKGFELTADDIYSIDKTSYKDAVMLFGGGCTGELVSPDGLLLTNHHCGFSQLQKHSSVEHDYLQNGFWAMNRGEELPNPGLTVKFLVRMDDVTDAVMAGVGNADDVAKDQSKKTNMAKVIKEAIAGTHYTAEIKPLYYGNQYYIYVYEVFEDVRLVGAPGSSIGKLGGETDNWMWPRHTGDFMFFRVYAGKDNKPAPYSKDNVPYKSKKYFKISTAGIKEGDFALTYGYPARTQQYLLSDAVDYILNYSNPAKIKLRTMRIEEMQKARKSDPAIRIAYASKEAGVANSWKKWQGENLGLERLKTISKKQAYEREFEKWAQDKPQYKTLISDMREQYKLVRDYDFVADYINEAIGGIELYQAVKLAGNWIDNPTEVLPEKLKAFYKDYYPDVDKRIAVKLITEYIKDVPSADVPLYLSEKISMYGGVDGYVDMLYGTSSLISSEKLTAAVDTKLDLKKDPAVELYRIVMDMYNTSIKGDLQKYKANIEVYQKLYMQGQLEYEADVKSGRIFFPDANHTLRVSYGTVSGYSPEDGVWYFPTTTLEGIIAKDNPNSYEFNIPQKLRDIYATKEYGRWGVDGTVPVCFISNNQTSGGNSGSPILNGKGELIGVNFDRTWTSTMSDIEYDPVMCRNIGVDIRYVLFVTDKIGGAGYLFDEMTLVGNPSENNKSKK
ncbi:S46 family peptidase [Dysgonomonas massiliensis]|uniref:S46 family peptidase n=1 Tax=Dysgonomonas massiliensis TaxID=2040292 RepID=UPI000C777D9D|nr:S46 family peptidase [Dysgonomonas massiliensis]